MKYFAGGPLIIYTYVHNTAVCVCVAYMYDSKYNYTIISGVATRGFAKTWLTDFNEPFAKAVAPSSKRVSNYRRREYFIIIL